MPISSKGIILYKIRYLKTIDFWKIWQFFWKLTFVLNLRRVNLTSSNSKETFDTWRFYDEKLKDFSKSVNWFQLLKFKRNFNPNWRRKRLINNFLFKNNNTIMVITTRERLVSYSRRIISQTLARFSILFRTKDYYQLQQKPRCLYKISSMQFSLRHEFCDTMRDFHT